MNPVGGVESADQLEHRLPFPCLASNNPVRLTPSHATNAEKKDIGFRSGSILTSEDDSDISTEHHWVCVLTLVEQTQPSPVAKRTGLSHRYWALCHQTGSKTEDKPLYLVNYHEIVSCRPPKRWPDEGAKGEMISTHCLRRLFTSLVMPAHDRKCNLGNARVHFTLDEWADVRQQQVIGISDVCITASY